MERERDCDWLLPMLSLDQDFDLLFDSDLLNDCDNDLDFDSLADWERERDLLWLPLLNWLSLDADMEIDLLIDMLAERLRDSLGLGALRDTDCERDWLHDALMDAMDSMAHIRIS